MAKDMKSKTGPIRPKTFACVGCGDVLPFDSSHFSVDSSRKFGLKYLCIACNKRSCRERRNANLEPTRKKDRERYARNPRPTIDRAKKAYAENPVAKRAAVASRKRRRAELGLPRYASPATAVRELHKNRERNLRRYRLEQDSGWTLTDTEFDRLLVEQNGRCRYCRTPFTTTGKTRATIDHVIPLAKGGTHTPDNIVLACLSCNSSKGAKDVGVFLAMIRCQTTPIASFESGETR